MRMEAQGRGDVSAAMRPRNGCAIRPAMPGRPLESGDGNCGEGRLIACVNLVVGRAHGPEEKVSGPALPRTAQKRERRAKGPLGPVTGVLAPGVSARNHIALPRQGRNHPAQCHCVLHSGWSFFRRSCSSQVSTQWALHFRCPFWVGTTWCASSCLLPASGPTCPPCSGQRTFPVRSS